MSDFPCKLTQAGRRPPKKMSSWITMVLPSCPEARRSASRRLPMVEVQVPTEPRAAPDGAGAGGQGVGRCPNSRPDETATESLMVSLVVLVRDELALTTSPLRSVVMVLPPKADLATPSAVRRPRMTTSPTSSSYFLTVKSQASQPSFRRWMTAQVST